jgi:hypothetical protein
MLNNSSKSLMNVDSDNNIKLTFVYIFLIFRIGSKKVHLFKGWRENVKAPENKPEWMPEEIWKPFVKKEKIGTPK